MHQCRHAHPATLHCAHPMTFLADCVACEAPRAHARREALPAQSAGRLSIAMVSSPIFQTLTLMLLSTVAEMLLRKFT